MVRTIQTTCIHCSPGHNLILVDLETGRGMEEVLDPLVDDELTGDQTGGHDCYDVYISEMHTFRRPPRTYPYAAQVQRRGR